MTREHKRLRQFFERPGSLRYREIESILISFGFEKIIAKGSHVKFKHSSLTRDLIIPVHNNECVPFYKKLALAFVKDLPNSNIQ
jgi:predicted RNA binding protein YcfA (HicA-like mRNA interferase family)